MPISLALRRLLRIRELEEEQSRIALETALGEMNRLKAALLGTAQRGQEARRLLASSLQSGNPTDRVACLHEMGATDNLASALSRKLATAAPEMVRLRERLLAKRILRQQAESVIKESDARAESEEERRNQRDLDDLNRARTKRRSVNRG
jgi:flagellar export protein FliJ